jgi:hypothetical protein
MASSVTERGVFRELSGVEYKRVLADELTAKIIEILERSGRFQLGAAFPVVRCVGSFHIKVLPGEQLPEPFIVGVDTGNLPAGEPTVEGEAETFEVTVENSVGTSAADHPDRVRGRHGLEVKQPRRSAKGEVRNERVK